MYTTKEIAEKIGVHVNTIRLYEKLGFLPKIPRKSNGYREYSKIHLEQLLLVRMGFKSELLQNGLRKQVIEIIKTSAKGDYIEAKKLADAHLLSIAKEKENAMAAINIVEKSILKDKKIGTKTYTRSELAYLMCVKIDTLRNWELNGLIKTKRKQNGYRVYGEQDVKRIRIIKALRCGNFSLSAILRLLCELEDDERLDIQKAIDTPRINENIVSACDKLLTSLENASKEGKLMLKQIKKIQKMQKTNPLL